MPQRTIMIFDPASRATLDRLTQALTATAVTLEKTMTLFTDAVDAATLEMHNAVLYIGSLVTELAAANAANDQAAIDAAITKLQTATAELSAADKPTVAAGAGSSTSAVAP